MTVLDSPIVDAWKHLARHAERCVVCGPLVIVLRRVPDDPRRTDLDLHPRFCPDGRELHGAWRAAKDEWLETTREYRRRLGVLGASQEAVLLRDEAWCRIPAPDRLRVLNLPDAERFRLLESIEAGILAERQAGQARREREIAENLTERTCRLPSCGEKFLAPRDSKERYCSEEHAREDWRRRRT